MTKQRPMDYTYTFCLAHARTVEHNVGCSYLTNAHARSLDFHIFSYANATTFVFVAKIVYLYFIRVLVSFHVHKRAQD